MNGAAALAAMQLLAGAALACSATTSRRWTCSASCNVQQIDRDVQCPDQVTGSASRSS
jgi:hypothetical protein